MKAWTLHSEGSSVICWLNAAEVVELDPRYSICTLAFFKLFYILIVASCFPRSCFQVRVHTCHGNLNKALEQTTVTSRKSQQGEEAVSIDLSKCFLECLLFKFLTRSRSEFLVSGYMTTVTVISEQNPALNGIRLRPRFKILTLT